MSFEYVPPQLPSRVPAKLAFVGEAPASEEMDEGKPLIGPSGRAFNALLRSANISREETLITNLFDTEVPNDEALDKWKAGGPEVEAQTQRLMAELEAAQPTVVVPLGTPAFFAFTGNRGGILQNRGAITAATLIRPGQKLVPTYHPAFVLRQWQMFPVVVGDLVRAAAQAEAGPQIILPYRELTLEPSIEDIRRYLPRLLSSKLLSVDIETTAGQITDIGFAPDKEHAINIPFWDARRPNRSYWATAEEEAAAWLLVEQVLTSSVPKLGQNYGAYDAYWLLDKYRIPTMNLRHDTRLLHHALYAELPKSLAFMGASYTEQGAWKQWGHTAQSKEKRDD